MQLMLIKPAFGLKSAASLTNLLSSARGGQFLFPGGLDGST